MENTPGKPWLSTNMRMACPSSNILRSLGEGGLMLENAVFEADIYGKVNCHSGDDNRCQVRSGYRLAGQD
jgi:hypothetical protein